MGTRAENRRSEEYGQITHVTSQKLTLNGTIEVADLLVASGAVGVSLERELGQLLPLLLEIVQALGVLLDGCLEVGILVLLVALLLVRLGAGEAGFALGLHLLPAGLDLAHHALNVGIAGVETAGQFQSLVRTGDVSALHLLIGLAAVGGDLLPALELGNVLLHLLEVGVGRLDGEAALQGLDATLQIVHALLGGGQTEVSLDEVLVGLDARARGFAHLLVVAELFVTGGHVGPVGRDGGIDGGGGVVLLNGLGILAGLEEGVTLALDGFCLSVRHAGICCGAVRWVGGD